MAAYKCNVQTAKIYDKIGGTHIQSLQRGGLFFSDGKSLIDLAGVEYFYGNCTINGKSVTGYVKKSQLEIVQSAPQEEDPAPDPKPTTGDIELVLDDASGALKKVSQGGEVLWQRSA